MSEAAVAVESSVMLFESSVAELRAGRRRL